MATKTQCCPGCGSVQYLVTGPEAPGFVLTISGRTFQQPAYSIRECSSCGLLYRDLHLDGTELDDYYSRADFQNWEISGHHPTERAALAVLRALPRGARILDFGCSSGRLLAPLVGGYECCGFEVNVPAAQAAAAKGIKMMPPDFLDLGDPSSFDAVVLVDVFEHLSSPTELMRKLFVLVKQGGFLILVTGNGDATACRLDPAQFWYFRNMEHLCMFTRRYADILARELGGTLEKWEEMSHYDSILRNRIRSHIQHFAYWRIHRRSRLASSLLSVLPYVNRVTKWNVAPGYSSSRDHVVVAIRKAGRGRAYHYYGGIPSL